MLGSVSTSYCLFEFSLFLIHIVFLNKVQELCNNIDSNPSVFSLIRGAGGM